MEDNQLSAIKLADRIGIASRNIESNIKKLKEFGILVRHGSPKNGYWEVIDCGKKNNEDTVNLHFKYPYSVFVIYRHIPRKRLPLPKYQYLFQNQYFP